MEFRPCIDIHNGKVKQIVGGSLKDEKDFAKENFVSEMQAADYAALYREKGLRGGHIILLNAADSPYYEADLMQAKGALLAWQGALQVGGGIYCTDDFGEDAVVAYDSGLTAVQALNNGQVDAVVIDNAPAKEYVAANPGLKVLETSYAEEDYAIGMAKGSSLEDVVNAALEELKADGTLQSIVDKYITAE